MQVKEIKKELHLSYIADNFEQLVKEAKETRPPYDEFLYDIFALELENRTANRLKTRLKDARFPFKKYLQDLDLDEYDTEIKHEIEDLMSLQFIKDKENVICIGNPGRGNYAHFQIMLTNGLFVLLDATKQPCSSA